MDLAKFDGLVNVRSADSLSQSELAQASNVDVLDDGRVRTRPGLERINTESGAHSLFVSGDVLIYRIGTQLKALDMAGVHSPVLLMDGLGDSELSYCQWGSRVYAVSPVHRIWIDAGRAGLFGNEIPLVKPGLSDVGGGLLPAGTYRVAFVDVFDPDGASCPGPSALIQCHNGAIRVTNPQATTARKRLVCVSSVNGSTLYVEQEIGTNEGDSVVVGELSSAVPALPFADPAPCGEQIGLIGATLAISSGAMLAYSEPYQPGRFSLSERFHLLPHPITSFGAVSDGVYVATTQRIYWLSGLDLDSAALSECYAYGALKGRPQEVEAGLFSSKLNGKALLLMTKQGAVLLCNGGLVIPLTEKRYKPQGHTLQEVAAVSRDDVHQALFLIR